MLKSWKYIPFTIWFFYLMVASVLLFSRGFLLKREIVTERSFCSASEEYLSKHERNTFPRLNEKDQSTGPNHEHPITLDNIVDLMNNLTVCVPPMAKVVLMVVDALRYDFIEYNEKLNQSHLLVYQNKVPVVKELLSQKPQNSRMFKFIADPPTTTMQRLKGLTTGSLPTFIDIGSNFASPEINEDNFIDQLLMQNRNIIFMGDDTWTSLYPKRFLREYAYPSFNVWDLDSVDNGIVYHLIPEILKNDWDVLIAHFLGVDHCGHKYGPFHPEMKRKLEEVNTVIRRVVDAIDKDTILFVFGDHGMTSTGDHGGESRDELTAALFVYSSSPLFPKELVEHSDTVSQVDLVPTLASLLGVPIPFSNLGKVIVGLLPSSGSDVSLDWKYAQLALWRNARQVKDYLDYYSENLNGFPPDKLQKLNEIYYTLTLLNKNVSDIQAFRAFTSVVEEYLSLARNMCSGIWVQFDLTLMISGLVFMVIFILLGSFVIEGIPCDRMQQMLNSNKAFSFIALKFITSLSVSLILVKFYMAENADIIFYFLTCFLGSVLLFSAIVQNRDIAINQVSAKLKLQDTLSFSSRLILLITFAGSFSNSYVVEESTLLSFLLVSISLLFLYFSCSRKDFGKPRHDKNKSGFRGFPISFKYILLLALFASVIRLSHHYWRCREEQNWCKISEWWKLSSSSIFSHGALHYLHSLVYLALLVTVFRMWLRSCGNLVGFSLTVMVVRYVPTVIAICISAFWILQGLPKDSRHGLKSWQIQVWPCVIFFLLGTSAIILYSFPLSVFKLPKTKVTTDGIYGQDNIIPHLFNQIKESLDKRNREKKFNTVKDFPVVYGLATVYSASLIILGLLILLLISLLLGDLLAPSVALMFLATVLTLAIQSVSRYERAMIPTQLLYVPWSSVLWWSLLSAYFFYGTGHQPTFPSIQWDAAFVGTGGHFWTHVIPAILIGINTFASQIWFGATVPLLLISPFTFTVMFPKFIKRDEVKGETQRGELTLYEKEGSFHHGMFILCSKYILFGGIRVFSSMLAAAIHRRHLMVWKIFAPKLIFESVGLFVSMFGVFLGYLLILRVTKALRTMMRSLEKDQ